MKFSHKNINILEEWLTLKRVKLSLDDQFIIDAYQEALLQHYAIKDIESVKTRRRAFTLQFDFVRRDLLKILYKQNNYSATGIKAGYVYALKNPAWPDYVKIGSAIDVNDRVASYQTSSPHRDYELISYFYSHDRVADEFNIHKLFERNGEWCKTTVDIVKELFFNKQTENNIVVPDSLLYAVKIQKEQNYKLKLLEQQRLKNKKTVRRKVY